ncbi:MAG TPA: AAA domain-containing protein, partial [Tepidiformaceae bacterium]|nr:AAA domain-containing protein [Tepidiformaceae bacterium]
EHATNRPKETLGVIAMGIKHAQRVEAAIEAAIQSRPDLDAFFDQSLDERFFVKNLERVQGDEREAILITVGYGKDRNGRLLNRFGPLNQEGGERRLNVAITRARRRLTLVSSFTHVDMSPERFTAPGVTLLRQYIAYCASGGTEIGGTASPQPPSDFEREVFDALADEGLTLRPRWGASGYRIDVAAQLPGQVDRFILAVECDGPIYAAASSARDRDRIRHEQIERRGWKTHRIWSTDWFMRREEELARVMAAYKAALEAATAPPPAPAARPGPPSTVPAAPLPLVDEEPAVPGRAPRPRGIGRRGSIDDYSPRELVAIVNWIRSDGRLRTDEELLEEAMDALGFSRRGPRIEAALREAIARAT